VHRAPPSPHIAPVPFAPETWSSAITTRDFARVVKEAEAHGLDRTLREVDATALNQLADFARYADRPEVAERALMAYRLRFKATEFSHSAAFFLGRLAEERSELGAGLAWYRRYLEERHDGPYAAEALGREMLAVERIAGRESARSVAKEYVRRFPNGTYMLQAHKILAIPTP
jgi:hypothetical protein